MVAIELDLRMNHSLKKTDRQYVTPFLSTSLYNVIFLCQISLYLQGRELIQANTVKLGRIVTSMHGWVKYHAWMIFCV